MPFQDLGLVGYWNASTNDRGLKSGKGTKGVMYEVSVAGSTVLDGIAAWVVGDFALFNGDRWRRLSALDGGSGVDFDTRAVAAAASIPVTVNVITTGGYSTPGDGGDGLYKRRSGAPTLTTNKAYFQSADGAWWELVAGEVRIEHFGGKADASTAGVGGTDNRQPLLDAIAFMAWTFGTGLRYPYPIRFGVGNHRFSAGFEIHDIVHITGAWGTGQYQGGTVFHFPNTVDPFIFQADNTAGMLALGSSLGSSTGSVLENVSIWGGGGLGIFTDINRVMIGIRSQATLRNISLYGIPGRGVWVIAGGGIGNANNWHIDNILIHEAGHHYLQVSGSDANGGYCRGLVTHGQGGRGGAGIVEHDGLGCNVYEGCQITGYGNLGVLYGGRLWALIAHTNEVTGGGVNIGGATTPGTNETVWYDLGPAVGGEYNPVQFPAWVSGTSYYVQNPVFVNSGASVFVGIYCEGSAIPGHVAGAAMAIGGNLPVTRSSTRMAPGTPDGTSFGVSFTQQIGTRIQFAAGSAETVNNGLESAVYIGGNDPSRGFGSTGGQHFIQHRRLAAGEAGSWRTFGYVGKDIFYGQYPIAFFEISEANTTKKFGGNLPKPNTFVTYDPVIGSYWDFSAARKIGMRDNVPSTVHNGEYVRGEHYYNINPSPGGYMGWVCTTSGGAAGAWVSGSDYSIDSYHGTYIKTAAGRYYKLTTDGPGNSTIEPTHTSGEVIGADGYGWTWFANVDAVFKGFGLIEA